MEFYTLEQLKSKPKYVEVLKDAEEAAIQAQPFFVITAGVTGDAEDVRCKLQVVESIEVGSIKGSYWLLDSTEALSDRRILLIFRRNPNRQETTYKIGFVQG